MYPEKTNIPLQGIDRCVLTGEQYQVPTAKLQPPIGTISPVADLHGRQKTL